MRTTAPAAGPFTLGTARPGGQMAQLQMDLRPMLEQLRGLRGDTLRAGDTADVVAAIQALRADLARLRGGSGESTRSARVLSETRGLPLNTRETVAIETSARAAMS